MKWAEFKSLLTGIAPDTALGRIVSVRAETDKNILKNFNKEQHRIRNEWQRRRAKEVTPQQRDAVLEQFKQAFIDMAGR